MNIVILSASVRIARNSNRVALYFENYIKENKLAEVEILDLNNYRFPVFDERLRLMKNPGEQVIEFADKITKCDGVIIVTPEYNGGYPASLKNVIDLLYAEWRRKPIALATVSNGPFGGAQVTTSLVFSLWKIGACVVPAMFPVPKVHENYNEEGVPTDKEAIDKRARIFLEELTWYITAMKKMNPQ